MGRTYNKKREFNFTTAVFMTQEERYKDKQLGSGVACHVSGKEKNRL